MHLSRLCTQTETRKLAVGFVMLGGLNEEETMKRAAGTTLTVLFCACMLWGQGAPQMPKPGPEQQRLQYFVGEWHTEGDMKPSPVGPGGKFTSSDHNMKFGDFFVMLHSDGQGAMGNVKTVAGMGYDSKEKLYTYDEYNTMGVHQVSKGTVSGDTWTWTNDSDFGGKTIKGRFILKEVSPKSYTFKYEISEDGNAWTNVMEGKSTKVEERSTK
jgi:hypothetical protein